MNKVAKNIFLEMSMTQKGYILVILYQILVSFSPLIIKNLSLKLPSALIVIGRYFFACISLFVVMLVNKLLLKKLLKLKFNQLKNLLILGVSSSGVGSLFYVIAITKIGIILTTYISSLEIVVTIVLSTFILKEKITKEFLFTSAIVLCGFFLLIYKGGLILNYKWDYIFGILCALISALVWGNATILGKKLLDEKISSVIITFVRHLSGVIFNIIVLLFTLRIQIIESIFSLTNFDWMQFLFLGIIISGIGFLLYYKGLKLSNAKGTALLLTISSVITTVLGITLGKEILYMNQFLGAFLVLFGVHLLMKISN